MSNGIDTTSNEDNASSARGVPQDRVLILCADTSNVEAFVRLFEVRGFVVECVHGQLSDVDVTRFGAVVHLARTAQQLKTRLGEALASIREEEWILVAGDGEDDFHCTVQLTRGASAALRAFVRSLWAQFNVA